MSYKLTYQKRFCSTKTALWVTERYAVIGQLVRSLFAKKKKKKCVFSQSGQTLCWETLNPVYVNCKHFLQKRKIV